MFTSRPTIIRTESSILIGRPAQEVSHFVADGFFDNYPKWSPEVTILEKTTPGPLRIGTTGRQVRNDAGYRTESEFRVTAYDPGHEIAFVSTGSPYYQVRYTFMADGDATRVTFSFELMITGMLKPFGPLLNRMIRSESRKILQNLRFLLDR